MDVAKPIAHAWRHSLSLSPLPPPLSLSLSVEWENDRKATLTQLESHGRGVFDSVVLSASRTGPVLMKTVLDYSYGHYALLGRTEDFVFVYDLK